MRALLICVALIAPPAFAGQVYKCKGPKGDVTFTNIKCPDNAAAVVIGSYQAVSDSPDQYYAAVAAHQARTERAQEKTVADAESAAARGATRDQQQVADSGQSAERLKKVSDYRDTLKRWGPRMAGPAPAGYDAFVGPERNRPAPPKPPVINNCHGNGGGSVTCFGSDGSIANGHVNEDGHGTLFGSTGSMQQINTQNANGRNCVLDVNGFCN